MTVNVKKKRAIRQLLEFMEQHKPGPSRAVPAMTTTQFATPMMGPVDL